MPAVLPAPLKGILKLFFPRLYRHVSAWRQDRRDITAVREGYRLVPEVALQSKYKEALEFLQTRTPPGEKFGDYLEFGVYNGSSLACMDRALKDVGLNDVRLFGFDSFAGLPPEASSDDRGLWFPGQFKMDYRFAVRFLREQGVQMDRVVLVKGWFKDTLNESLLKKYAIRKASVIMVDCDMYLSAKTVLSFCAPLIDQHAVVLFDDWFAGGLAEQNLGEKKAFGEFLLEHPQFKATEFGDYGKDSKVFVVSRV